MPYENGILFSITLHEITGVIKQLIKPLAFLTGNKNKMREESVHFLR